MRAAIGKRLQRLRDDERGMALVYVGLGLMSFLAAGTLAIDVGMLMTARTQAQNAADAGALAGATAFVLNSMDDRSPGGPAVQSAVNTALHNKVMGRNVAVAPTDVTFPIGTNGIYNRVQINVFRTAGRFNPVATLLGPMFGVPLADVSATATAEASPASAMTCVKPFIIPNRWIEKQGNTTFDRYDNKGKLIANPDVFVAKGPNYTGYTAADVGTPMTLRAGTGSNIAPSSYFSWKMPAAIGGSYYEDNISGCNPSVIDIGYVAAQEPGNMVGPTVDGVKQLLAKDPTATWDPVAKTVKSAMDPSPRVFPIPLYDPDVYQQGLASGRNAVYVVSAFLPFFLESVDGNQVYGRIARPLITTVRQPADAPVPENSLIYTVRLVQ